MDLYRGFSRNPAVIILITFAVSFLMFYLFFRENLSSASSSVTLNVKNCEISPVPSVSSFANRRPQVLQSGRVRVVDYDKFPNDERIECVKHHAAFQDKAGTTWICVMGVSKDMISGALRTKNGWEPHITAAFRKALTICSDCQVLDFGANLGVYGLIGASAGRRVFAVEPMTENLMHLVKSVRKNKWEKRVTIITNTLSDVYEELEFWRPYRNAGGSIARRVGETPPDRKLYEGPFDKVSSVQIDNLLEIIDFNKAVMKIDIEGYEPRAFSGASRFLDQMTIPFIFMEWSNKGRNEQAFKMVQNLVRHGYAVYDPSWRHLGEATQENIAKWPFDIIWKKIK